MASCSIVRHGLLLHPSTASANCCAELHPTAVPAKVKMQAVDQAQAAPTPARCSSNSRPHVRSLQSLSRTMRCPCLATQPQQQRHLLLQEPLRKCSAFSRN